MKRMILGVVALVASQSLLADTLVASWNAKRLGHGERDWEATATVIAPFDLVALQEVMTDDAVFTLERVLERKTGEKWSSLVSHAVGRGSYFEHYAFLYRDSSIAYAEGAAVFLDIGDVFSREPFSAVFQVRDTGERLAVGQVHALYGKTRGKRPGKRTAAEIAALADYWRWMTASYRADRFILAGDFNTYPDHPAFASLDQAARPLNRKPTTLSSRDSTYRNTYDNMWVPDHSELQQARRVDMQGVLNMTHRAIRARVSDHAPLYVLLP